MSQEQVIPECEKLLACLDTLIPDLENQALRLMHATRYQQAQDMLSKADAVKIFRKRVLQLREDWKKIGIIPDFHAKSYRHGSKRLAQGLRTHKNAFKMPILSALVTLGGRAPRKQVFNEVEKIMANQLNSYDKQPIPSNPNKIRWQNNAGWARQDLISCGFLAADSAWGMWQITDAGRKALQAHLDKQMGKKEQHTLPLSST